MATEIPGTEAGVGESSRHRNPAELLARVSWVQRNRTARNICRARTRALVSWPAGTRERLALTAGATNVRPELEWL